MADDDTGVNSQSQQAILVDPLKDLGQNATNPQHLAEIAFATAGAEDSALAEVDMNTSKPTLIDQTAQDNDRNQTLRALEGMGNVEDRASERKTWNAQRRRDVSHSSQEDLFLNLARDDTTSQDVGAPLSRVEERRVSGISCWHK